MLPGGGDLREFGRYCLKPEESSRTTDWLCLCSGFEPLGALKGLFWIIGVVAGIVALC